MPDTCEVEYRALLDKERFNNILKELRVKYPKNAHEPQHFEDAYFCRNEVSNFSEIEMDKVGSYSLRLRKAAEPQGGVITLNTKIIKNYGDHNSWLEHEITVSSYEDCKALLESMGFKIFFEYHKDRYEFNDDGVKVCLEDIENFQPAIEVEIITPEDNSANAKRELLAYLKKKHVDETMLVHKSITNMLMRERAKF